MTRNDKVLQMYINLLDTNPEIQAELSLDDFSSALLNADYNDKDEQEFEIQAALLINGIITAVNHRLGIKRNTHKV